MDKHTTTTTTAAAVATATTTTAATKTANITSDALNTVQASNIGGEKLTYDNDKNKQQRPHDRDVGYEADQTFKAAELDKRETGSRRQCSMTLLRYVQ